MKAHALFLLGALTACVQSGATVCSEDFVCAPGTSCVPLVAGGFACASSGEAICGDGVRAEGEACEPSLDAACTATCTKIVCGDGTRDVGEVCDDGNTLSHDGCDSVCELESALYTSFPLTRPAFANRAAAAFDARRGETVVFGGSGRVGREADTWVNERSGHWTSATTAITPPARDGHTMVYDPDRARIVMFGGQLSTRPAADLWLWDGTQWSLGTANETGSASQPSPRSGHAMAYDPVMRQVVVYGGESDGRRVSDDAWAWDDSGWIRIEAPAISLTEPAMTSDPVRGGVVLVGKGPSETMTTFTRAGSAWIQQPWQLDPLESFELVTDPSRGEVLLVGMTGPVASGTFEVYRLTSGGWVATGERPGPRVDFAIAPSSTGVLILGGNDGTSTPLPVQQRSNAAWVDVDDAVALPFVGPPRGNVAVDLTQHRMLGFPRTGFSDLVELTGGRPVLIPAVGHGVTQAHEYRLAYHEASGELILVSKADAPGSLVETHVGTRSGATWTFRDVTGSGPTQIAPLVYDAGRQQMVTVTPDVAGTMRTWVFDGLAWQALANTTPPPARFNYALGYDRARDAIILFGGTERADYVGYGNETWLLDASGWQLLSATGPIPRADAGLAYDLDRKRMVLVGGTLRGSGLADAWELTGSTWSPLAVQTFGTQVYVASTLMTSPDGVGVTMLGWFKVDVTSTWTQARISWTSGATPEACQRLDSDGDGQVGCADDGCWHQCTPLCRPDDGPCTSGPQCGDSREDPLESCGVCVADEGTCNVCGDFVCDPGETCPGDCR